MRTDFPATDGVAASRTDFVPDGVAGALVGLTLRSGTTRTVMLRADAHSELMGSYPWGETTPSQTTVNLPDTGAVDDGALVFRDQGTPPGQQPGRARLGRRLRLAPSTPTGTQLGQGFRGPTTSRVVCPASGPDTNRRRRAATTPRTAAAREGSWPTGSR